MDPRRRGEPHVRWDAMKTRYCVPLVGFVIPTVVIGYGVVIPRSCIAGVNELTIGFATTVIGACLTYVVGIRLVLKDATRAAT